MTDHRPYKVYADRTFFGGILEDIRIDRYRVTAFATEDAAIEFIMRGSSPLVDYVDTNFEIVWEGGQ
jgi:hypothetical protein